MEPRAQYAPRAAGVARPIRTAFRLSVSASSYNFIHNCCHCTVTGSSLCSSVALLPLAFQSGWLCLKRADTPQPSATQGLAVLLVVLPVYLRNFTATHSRIPKRSTERWLLQAFVWEAPATERQEMSCPKSTSVVFGGVTPLRHYAAPRSTSAGLLQGMQLHPDDAIFRGSQSTARRGGRAWSCVAEVMVSHWAGEGDKWMSGCCLQNCESRFVAWGGRSFSSKSDNEPDPVWRWQSSRQVLETTQPFMISAPPAGLSSSHSASIESDKLYNQTLSLPMPPSPTPRNQSPTGKVTLATSKSQNPSQGMRRTRHSRHPPFALSDLQTSPSGAAGKQLKKGCPNSGPFGLP